MLESVYEELKQESKRWSDKNYNGVIFVHPDDRKLLVRHLLMEYNFISISNKDFKLHSGGNLRVSTLEGKKEPQFDYMGCEFTTILISKEAFGKYGEDCEFTYVNKNLQQGGIADFYMYMITRSRSRSKFHSKVTVF